LVIVKEPTCDVQAITRVLSDKIGEIQVDQDVGAELSYSLPEAKSHLFGEMFGELERRKEQLGIASYGASITTMEEVFVRYDMAKRAYFHTMFCVNKPFCCIPEWDKRQQPKSMSWNNKMG